ncbi:hypothetical protein [Sphingomonas sp. CFBP 8760]|uniref:hypothetical protein n=1 Tax=Sphingomonas sp. CFBP 8760 TaxID=2775282 RepID=UPI001781AEE3|nr:hypothetical protein [Sphingomonas sp. CFBP 8760]MBD8548974.1 hypothetical protein [Sphingomonas sp. CFBP 8760]
MTNFAEVPLKDIPCFHSGKEFQVVAWQLSAQTFCDLIDYRNQAWSIWLANAFTIATKFGNYITFAHMIERKIMLCKAISHDNSCGASCGGNHITLVSCPCW